MAHAGINEPPLSNSRPFVASYDLGYEYSQEHYIELQCLVEDADEDASFAHAPHLEKVAS